MTADTLTRCRDPRPVLAGFTTAVSGWALTDTWDWEFYDRDDREFRGTVAIRRLPGRAASRSAGRILAALEGPLAELAADGWESSGAPRDKPHPGA